MKINKLYICLVMMLFNMISYSNEFDEFGYGPWSFPGVSEMLPNGEIVTPQSYSEGYMWSTAVQREINDVINSVHATPQTTYSWTYVNGTYTKVQNLSPSEKNLYVPSAKDFLIPWYTDASGQQWYTLYRNYVPGYLDIRITTTLSGGGKSSAGYIFESTPANGNPDYSNNMNAYGGINFGGINTGYVSSTTPPVIFSPTTSNNLIDKLVLTSLQFGTLLDNLASTSIYAKRESVYAYRDSYDNTHIGIITILRNNSNGQTVQYFKGYGESSYVKLPNEVSGLELRDSNNGNSYNNGMVEVTIWDGTDNQPAGHNPKAVRLIDYNNGTPYGTHLIIVPVESNSPYYQAFPLKAYYNAIPRIYRPNFVPGSDRDTAELLYENNDSLSLEQALFIKREYFDVQVPDLKGAIDVYMQDLINKVKNGLPDNFKLNSEELLIFYAKTKDKYPEMTLSQFENRFMGRSEGIDTNIYDSTFWDNPNLVIPQQSLPTWANFSANFPYDSDPLYDSPQKMYNSIGGTVATIYSGPNTNTCAIRLSKALNYSGVVIPNWPGKTYQGADGKFYFKAAYEINLWMRKTFGTNPASTVNPKTPYNPNHSQYSASDAGQHGVNLPSLLLGKQGIYSIYSSQFSWATGHADLLKSDATCGNECHFYDAPIYRLDVWNLN